VSDLTDAWRRAQLAEVAWVDDRGDPRVDVVVPLLRDGVPALALGYDQLDLARGLAAAEQVTWAVTVPAVAAGAAPIAAAAHVEVAEDPRGEDFAATSLLDQLLAKHPPARRRLDSPLLRREHGWYLPRLLVRTIELGPSFALAPAEALAVAATGGAPWLGAARDLSLGEGTARVDLPDGSGVLLQHGADVPELETPWHRRWRGTVGAGVLRADERDEVAPARRRPNLRERIRAERRLELACRAGLREAGVR
jgi:hypothetical protein